MHGVHGVRCAAGGAPWPGMLRLVQCRALPVLCGRPRRQSTEHSLLLDCLMHSRGLCVAAGHPCSQVAGPGSWRVHVVWPLELQGTWRCPVVRVVWA